MKITHFSLQLAAAFFLFTACKKENAEINNSALVVTASDTSLSKTDGIITVQTAILPPVTPRSFIAAGNSSTARFDIVTTRRIFIYQLFFSATYPLIQSLKINNLSIQPNAGGTITFNGSGPYINGGSGYSLITHPFYINIDNSNSGKTAQLALIRIVYRTDDEVYHDFYLQNAGKAHTMCLVNNIPHIKFENPFDKTLENGFRQIAVLRVTGDTAYSITDLPLHLSSPFGGFIPKSSLIAKYSGEIVGKTDSVQLDGGTTADAIIHFEDAFKHTAGNTELLKIFAPVFGANDLILTSMSADNFRWIDDLGVVIPGPKNSKFYKEQTGQAVFH